MVKRKVTVIEEPKKKKEEVYKAYKAYKTDQTYFQNH